MKKYIGTKRIEAKSMTRGEYNNYRGWTIPENENPDDAGYLVKYSDDYESWSPAKQFDEAYRECDNMTFGLAVEALKKGLKVTRKGWNGKGMWLCLAGGVAEAPMSNFILENTVSGFLPWIGMKTANDTFVPWLASQTDILSEDWMVVE